jgi:ferrous iron transport protein B
MSFKIAIAGNPNSGKSTIFNQLTGSNQHVGNYPGVTVEKREGYRKTENYDLLFIDLPGTYSLSARSQEELIARKYLLEEKPDLVINVVDASHAERNLYLTTQLIELGLPIVIAMNMYDLAESKGHSIDLEKLSALIGIPIIKTIGNKKEGIDELAKFCNDFISENKRIRPRAVNYGDEIEEELAKVEPLLGDRVPPGFENKKRFLAIKLFEKDEEILKVLSDNNLFTENLRIQLKKSTDHLKKIFNEDAEILVVDKRYGYISGAYTDCAQSTPIRKHDYSDLIDIVLTHKFFGLPIFLGIMWLLFSLTFKAGDPFVKGIEYLFSKFIFLAQTTLPEGLIRSLVSDGIIAGVGGVVSFVPNIMILFLLIAILEDSGYMPRAAFLMDNLMHKIGLHGKSFIPLLIGFGCSVPAIMATRTLESKRDRITTMLLVPLMSCSARLPVYTLLIGAFFTPKYGGHMLFLIYIIGILAAIMVAKIIEKFEILGPSTPFVMELPPYMMPTLRGVFTHMWTRSWHYLKKAGTIIFAISVILWFLSNFPSTSADNQERLKNSFVGYAGKVLSPVMAPIGLGDWKVSVSVVTGFTAKEVVVSTLGTLYSLDDVSEKSPSLRSALKSDPFFSPLKAFVMMVFVLLSCPCMATFAIMKQETRSWRWPLLMAGYMTVLAWTACLVIYQVGRFLGF